MSFVIKHSELVEISTGNNGNVTSLPFPNNNENIERSLVTGIQVVASSNNMDGVNFSPSGTDVVTETFLKQAFLILSVDNDQKVVNLPLSSLTKSANNGNIQAFNRLKINFTKSKIMIPKTVGSFIEKAVLLNFYFESENDCKSGNHQTCNCHK